MKAAVLLRLAVILLTMIATPFIIAWAIASAKAGK